MGDYGLKVSNLGQDAGTAVDKDLQFTTKYSTLKFYQAGTSNVTSGNGTTTVAHNLGFSPAFFAWRKITAQNNFLSGGTTYPNSYIQVGVPNSWENISFNTKQQGGFIHAYTDDININLAVSGAVAGTYDFKHYILVDLANDFSGTDPSITDQDYGFKVSKSGVDVKTAKEYELAYSSKYKALQYYPESLATASLSMPNATASLMDQEVTGGDFVDIEHGLGYPPFHLVYFDIERGESNEIPNYSFSRSTGQTFELISSFCDSTRIRVSWYRTAYLNQFEIPVNDLGGTINIKVIVFTEDLSSTSL